jgi:hypothetical protein
MCVGRQVSGAQSNMSGVRSIAIDSQRIDELIEPIDNSSLADKSILDSAFMENNLWC